MTWKFEIYRALLLALGTAEIITNGTYLMKKNGMTNARKQHQELPADITDSQMRMKVTLMFIFGCAFFMVSLMSYFMHTFLQTPVLIILVLFFFYGVCEALYYRYWKTYGFAGVTAVILGCYLFI